MKPKYKKLTLEFVNNNFNSKIYKNNKTGIKGITIVKKGKYIYYRSKIMKDHKSYIKIFPYTDSGLQDAKEWLDAMRKELHGEFARYE